MNRCTAPRRGCNFPAKEQAGRELGTSLNTAPLPQVLQSLEAAQKPVMFREAEPGTQGQGGLNVL